MSSTSQAENTFWASKRRLENLRRGVIFAVIVVLSLVMIVPLAWMVAVSLKESQNVFQMPPWHVDWRWSNYAESWYPHGYPQFGRDFWSNMVLFFTGNQPFWVYLFNTVLVTTFSTLGTLISCTVVAFGFARLRFPGRNALFLLILSTMMIPTQVTMIPTFILFTKLGWVDTFLPLIVPNFFGTAFNIFLLRQFFMTIPMELDEAARIDGCTTFGIFWRILLPLTKPALTSVAVFSIVYNWNDFMNPLIYLNSSAHYTLSLGLSQFTSLYGNKTNLMMAASTITLMPILIVFFFGQKYFIQGIATTGLKG